MVSPITRSADHIYSYEKTKYPGVTGILGVMGANFHVAANYGAKHASMAAVELASELPKMIETVGADGAAKAIASAGIKYRDEAAQLGTEVHRLADLVVTGKPTPPMTQTIRNRVMHYVDWWTNSGWTLRLSEAMVILPDEACGFGGTFDLLARDRDGRTVLADIKTGKAVYHEAVLQMAAYGMAKYVQPAEADRVYPMPDPDRFVIIHVTADGVREVEVAVGIGERSAFLACRELHTWRESMKGRKL